MEPGEKASVASRKSCLSAGILPAACSGEKNFVSSHDADRINTNSCSTDTTVSDSRPFMSSAVLQETIPTGSFLNVPQNSNRGFSFSRQTSAAPTAPSYVISPTILQQLPHYRASVALGHGHGHPHQRSSSIRLTVMSPLNCAYDKAKNYFVDVLVSVRNLQIR